MSSADTYDVVIIGGGIAGVSLAGALSGTHRVVVLDMEDMWGHHSTGRSVATFLETYGNEVIRALTVMSRADMEEMEEEAGAPILTPMPVMWVAGPGREKALRELHAQASELVPSVSLLDSKRAAKECRLLSPEWGSGAVLEPDGREIDVHALHQVCLRRARRAGSVLRTGARVVAVERDNGWIVRDEKGEEYHAPLVVNAAGAWADRIAHLFGAQPVGLQPMLRTVFTSPVPPEFIDTPRSLISDIDEAFYIKVEAQQLVCSPADELPQEPADARADMIEISRALDDINDATRLNLRHVSSRWGGLRSFVPDRTPVVGLDPLVEGLFWFAGQGGYGIQMAPALARVGAQLITGIEDEVLARSADGIDPLLLRLDPKRFAQSAHSHDQMTGTTT